MKERSMPLHIMEKMSNFGLNEGLVIKTEGVDEEYGHKTHPLTNKPGGKRCSRVATKSQVDKCSIKLGQTFQSFYDVSQAITMYEIHNKVSLTQKYFRRIAANPKPSNKEDFSLSEEERKRFVYRWVDFCCTYFDDLVTRSDQNEDGNGTSQVLGFAMKECPMRIRFQLRFTEKDLMISILKEEHDHTHPNIAGPIASTQPELQKSNDNVITSMTNVGASKRPGAPPPSLAPLHPSKFLKHATSVQRPNSVSHPPGHLTRTPTKPNPALPKPPPLKAMPTLSRISESSNLGSSNGGAQGLSTEDVIKNIYHYLCRVLARGSKSDSELRFASPHPNLIKITSELSGVDTARVLEVCRANRPQVTRNVTVNQMSYQNQTSLPKPIQGRGSSLPAMKMTATIQHREPTRSIPNLNFSDTTVPSSNTHMPFSNQFHEESIDTTSFIDIPVEVIIKSEPDETVVDYYDENDSDSSATNSNYFGNEQTDAHR